MSLFRMSLAGLAMAGLTACAPMMAPPYPSNYAALDQLKKQPNSKVAVGTFEPRDPAAPVNKISLRAASMVSPSGSFAQYLEQALISDLREIAIYDAKAGVRVDASVKKNDIDISGFSEGKGTMEVDLTVRRGETVALKKLYAASIQFPSSFMGNVAIPRGQSEYGNLVSALLGKIYGDADFIAAIKQ